MFSSEKHSKKNPHGPVPRRFVVGSFGVASVLLTKGKMEKFKSNSFAFARYCAVLAIIALASRGVSMAVGTADADVSSATDDLVATYTYIKPFALTALAVLMGIAVLKKFWKRIVS